MYQYSFANVDLVLDIPDASGNYESNKIKGFGTGENLINVMRRAPIATTQFSAYGDMVVSMQRIRAGDLTFPVLMNAPENKKLQDYANYFQQQADADGALIFPIQGKLTDNMGKDEAVLTNGIILAMPAMSRGQTMNTITWVVTFEKVVFKRENGDDLAQFGA
tara:strand:- start:691 stop:1179 length:489 start_codon:yes stop_codon:yes gene_type:complete